MIVVRLSPFFRACPGYSKSARLSGKNRFRCLLDAFSVSAAPSFAIRTFSSRSMRPTKVDSAAHLLLLFCCGFCMTLLDFAEPSPLSSSPSICEEGLIIPRSLGRVQPPPPFFSVSCKASSSWIFVDCCCFVAACWGPDSRSRQSTQFTFAPGISCRRYPLSLEWRCACCTSPYEAVAARPVHRFASPDVLGNSMGPAK
jgi:hypothetical protein